MIVICCGNETFLCGNSDIIILLLRMGYSCPDESQSLEMSARFHSTIATYFLHYLSFKMNAIDDALFQELIFWKLFLNFLCIFSRLFWTHSGMILIFLWTFSGLFMDFFWTFSGLFLDFFWNFPQLFWISRKLSWPLVLMNILRANVLWVEYT